MKTFWMPVDVPDEFYSNDDKFTSTVGYIEHDLKNERFMKRVGAMENID